MYTLKNNKTFILFIVFIVLRFGFCLIWFHLPCLFVFFGGGCIFVFDGLFGLSFWCCYLSFCFIIWLWFLIIFVLIFGRFVWSGILVFVFDLIFCF